VRVDFLPGLEHHVRQSLALAGLGSISPRSGISIASRTAPISSILPACRQRGLEQRPQLDPCGRERHAETAVQRCERRRAADRVRFVSWWLSRALSSHPRRSCSSLWRVVRPVTRTPLAGTTPAAGLQGRTRAGLRERRKAAGREAHRAVTVRGRPVELRAEAARARALVEIAPGRAATEEAMVVKRAERAAKGALATAAKAAPARPAGWAGQWRAEAPVVLLPAVAQEARVPAGARGVRVPAGARGDPVVPVERAAQEHSVEQAAAEARCLRIPTFSRTA
jgi:hypothetical protein